MLEGQFQPAVPVRTYERVVEQVRDAIISGRLNPGDHLPSERDLMVQFSVSRPTVREALRVLQNMGLVASRPGGRGPEILSPSSDAFVRQFETMARLKTLPTVEIVQFRMALESAAARLAAAVRSDEQLVAMRHAVERMEAAVGQDPDAFAVADSGFHDAVLEASGNSLLKLCGRAMSTATIDLIAERLASTDQPHQKEADSVALDRALFEAIERRDPDAAGQHALTALFEGYAGYLPAPDRRGLEALLDGSR